MAFPFAVKEAEVRRTKPSPLPSSVPGAEQAATDRTPSLKQDSIRAMAAARRTTGPPVGPLYVWRPGETGKGRARLKTRCYARVS